MGDVRGVTYSLRKASICSSTAASSSVEALTRSMSPDLPWVDLFHASMPSMMLSG